MYNVSDLWPSEPKPKLGVGSFLKYVPTGDVYLITSPANYVVSLVKVGGKLIGQYIIVGYDDVLNITSVKVNNVHDITYKEARVLLGPAGFDGWKLLTSKKEVLAAMEAALKA